MKNISINENYAPGEILKGHINISLENENSGSFLNDSLGNSIRLLDLLGKKENANFTYSCEGVGCNNKYSAENPSATREEVMSKDDSILIGIKLKGIIEGINYLNFTLNGNSEESCINQIELDFFEDNEINIINNRVSSIDCATSETRGCLEDIETLEQGDLLNIELSEKVCQRLTLPIAPGFKAGAWINKTNISTKNNISVEIYSQGEVLGDCKIKYNDISSADQYGCQINYSVLNPKEVYICVDVLGSGGGYQTQGYLEGDIACGFLGAPAKEEIGAYRLFVKGKKFDKPNNFQIANPKIEGNRRLNNVVMSYLSETYEQTSGGNIDCSDDCIIPLKIISKVDQIINLNNLILSYSRLGAGEQTSTNFYELSLANSVLSSDFQNLYLNEANFSLPQEEGEFDYTLELGGEEILSKEFLILNSSNIKSLTPTRVPVLYSVEYSVEVENPETIVKYIWNMGNQTRETTTNKIKHTFSEEGTKNIKVSVENTNSIKTSKDFQISVESFEDTINKTIIEGLENIDNLRVQLNSFSDFEKEVFNQMFDLNKLSENISSIQKDFLVSGNMSKNQKQKMLSDLLEISIPESINKVKSSNNLIFYPKESKIQASRLSDINEEDYDSSKNYKSAILEWHQLNIDSKISFSSFLLIYKDKQEKVNIFDLSINKKESSNSNPYFILSELGGLYLQEKNSWIEKNNYIYKTFNKSSTNVKFSTTEDIDFDEIPFFITPSISYLNEMLSLKNLDEFEPEEDKGKWIIYFVIIFFLIIIGFVIYVFLYKWYEYNYESHLFRSRNDLYNLINYINLLRNNNIEVKEIENRLKKAGWNYEQRAYVLKKYLGKRTGMPKILLIDKLISRKKPGKTNFKSGIFDKLFSKFSRKSKDSGKIINKNIQKKQILQKKKINKPFFRK